MRRITICAIAAIAALAMTAAIGAASASAGTVLCSKAETVCASGNVLPSGSNLSVGKGPLAGKFSFGAGYGSVTCDYAVINSISTKEAANPLPGKSEVGIYPENCRISVGTAWTENCKSLTFNNPSETFEATGGGSGVIYLGSKSEPWTLSFTCYNPFFSKEANPISCTYQANSAVPLHYDGYTATIKKEESPMTKTSGTNCGTSSAISAELERASEPPAFISTHSFTVLCSKAETVCANGNVKPSGSNISVGKGPYWGKFVVATPTHGSLTCDYAVINSISTQEAGSPLLSGKSEVGVYPENCRFTFGGLPTENCQSLTSNSPSETFEATGGGSGVINLGSKSEPLTLSFTCYNPTVGKEGNPVSCTYQANGSIPLHYNVSTGTTTIKQEESSLARTPASGFHCDSSASMSAELETVTFSPTYISTI